MKEKIIWDIVGEFLDAPDVKDAQKEFFHGFTSWLIKNYSKEK